jgi:hypothetical protein
MAERQIKDIQHAHKISPAGMHVIFPDSTGPVVFCMHFFTGQYLIQPAKMNAIFIIFNCQLFFR